MKRPRLRRRGNVIAALTGSLITISIIIIATVIYLKVFWVDDRNLVPMEEYIHINDLQEIIVSNTEILQGEQITEEMIDTICIDGDSSEYITDLASTIGQYCVVNIRKGMPILKTNLYEEIDIRDDLRNHEITYIKLPTLLKKGDYIDIRISFPDGEDYIVVTKKQVEKVEYQEDNNQSTMWIHLLENERLHLSSAIVEAAAYEGAGIYAISYVLPEIQEEAVVNYPVNQNVYNLILNNPNIVDEAIKKLTICGNNSYTKHQEEFSLYE